MKNLTLFAYIVLILFCTIPQTFCETIRGINWFGFETQYSNLMCMWNNQPIDWHVDKMKNLHFNYIRLPFSLDFVNSNNWENMDSFFDITMQKNMSVLLDFHRLNSNNQSPLPYDSSHSFNDFLNGWETILNRYSKYTNLLAVDVFNEYQGNSFDEWNRISQEIVLFIESKFPQRFTYYVGGINWGGNISGMKLPLEEEEEFRGRIVYTMHKYVFSSGGGSEYNMRNNWDSSIREPAMIGEWGYISSKNEEVEFARHFVSYLKERNIRDSFFWTWSPNSGDTQGILKDDCSSVDEEKIKLLHDLWFGDTVSRRIRYLR